ncbi:MAG: beta-mannosidase, partial [Clostridia bacterium]|nr:beta-mannosidase [Clostridia bacterium]
PDRGAAFTNERLYTRRIQCTYYWDWVERFVTFGIYRPVYLCYPESAQIENIYIYTKNIDKYSAQIGLLFNIENKNSFSFAEYNIKTPTDKIIYSKKRRIVENYIEETIDIINPKLWYPNGYGEQPLYSLEIKILKNENDEKIIDSRTVKFGIRTVKILQLPDEKDSTYYEKCLELKKSPHVSEANKFWDRNEDFSGFILLVNNFPIMCKGANWVPCEPFPSNETDSKITNILELASLANMNMIRIWGGGIFEKEYFYEECDRLGLMVTQDFLMACGDYPEYDQRFIDNLKAETRHAALRLRSHPCLVWWSGDNENGMAADENMGNYTGRRAALGTIGPILRELDPWRSFLPSSPYNGIPYGSITKGTTHNTNYIGELFQYIRYNDFYNYREYFDNYLSRFCAEGPIMGAPSITSLRRFMTDEDIFGDDDEIWRHHTKNNPSEAFREFEIFDYLKVISEKLFGAAVNGRDKVFKMQYIEYEWVRISMELYRRNKWFSSGMIYWMLNDCWPASGWSLIDYYTLPKAGYYAFRRTAKPVICAITKEKEYYKVYVCNDSLDSVQGLVKLYVVNFDLNKIVYDISVEYDVKANSSAAVFKIDARDIAKFLLINNNNKYNSLLLCDIINDKKVCDRTFIFEKRPQDVNFPKAEITLITRTDNEITIKADKYVHAVSLEGEFIFDDNYFVLLPNEEKTIKYKSHDNHVNDKIEITGLYNV